jgi:CO dehydrogenase nickel-insertion accessory protein CooC1
MKRLLDQLQDGFLPATRHLASTELAEMTRRAYREARTRGALYVLNKVPDPDTEHFLWQRLLEAQIQVAASIPDDLALRRAWLEGAPLESAAADAEAIKLVRALEEGRGGFGAAREVAATLVSRTQGHPNARP